MELSEQEAKNQKRQQRWMVIARQALDHWSIDDLTRLHAAEARLSVYMSEAALDNMLTLAVSMSVTFRQRTIIIYDRLVAVADDMKGRPNTI